MGVAIPLLLGGSAQAATTAVWDQVAQCESSGNYAINTRNGYYGGLQFSTSTWRAYGGRAYAPNAHLATKEQQIAIAEKVLAGQGAGAWGPCSAPLRHAKPAAQEPKAQEPAAQEPKAQEPAAQEPKAQEPAAQEPKAQEPAAQEPKAQPAPQTPSGAAEGTYTVRPGDTLVGIARSHGLPDWHVLHEANLAAVPDPNVIRVGQVIRVPAADVTTTAAAGHAVRLD
ncbi:transglycosylase family protein [Streptomyces sp. IBSNAI002]|uniref:transglycosylase family protein n=1 Tax=Streptomyces sp. IBSNAI002 TaxID=3457500 RepID=UPI003FD5225A